MPDRVELRHVRFDDAGLLAKTVGEIVETRQHEGLQVDGLDGVAFEPGEYYLTLARWVSTEAADEASRRPPDHASTSDYTGQQVFYRSIQQRETDLLTMHDYLWRWDTDWFWCSGAFGAQNPTIRRLWPRRFRRSDVYHRLIGLNHRTGFMDWLDRRKGRPLRERVVQDVEVPVERLEEFLAWFDAEVGMRPVWLCPLVSPGTRPAPVADLPARSRARRTSTSASGAPCTSAPRPRTRRSTARSRPRSPSSAATSRSTPRRSTTGRPSTVSTTDRHLAAVKRRYDPEDRLSASTTRRCEDNDARLTPTSSRSPRRSTRC